MLDELSEEWRPKTIADGMQIQDAFAAEIGVPIAGWKIGCTSAAAQAILKTDAPFPGRIASTRIFPSGTVLPASGFGMRGIEGEFAFVLEKPLRPRKKPYTPAEVKAAIGAVVPVIEVVVSRFKDWHKVNTASLVADLGCNGALIVGKPITAWRRLDLVGQRVKVLANGKVVGEGRGADVLGDPLVAATWLVNFQRERQGLAIGEVISTGTCSGFYLAKENDKIEARFGKLGTVKLTFAS
jgi:2-keto-4-pentenoate hydratase